MSDTLPTVKVKRDGPKGYRIINERDFDPEKHELFGVEAPTGEGGETVPEPAAVLAMFDSPEIHFSKAKAEAKKLLGGQIPEKKADIIEALKALLPQE